jgi:DNA helicase-2/ATP-dependent DNA helicase PcrA
MGIVPEQPRWLEGIRGEQSIRLIESDGRVIKVLAGPGAGKTTCLKRRVLRLVDTAKVKRAQIFVGTFTRVIAKALHQAFIHTQTDPAKEEDDPVVSTLHSHAARLLRENPDAVQGRGFRFLLAHEEKVLLYDIADKVPQFSTYDDRHAELKELQAHWASPRNLNDERFASAVDEWLRIHGGMLVGEVVYITTDAIQNRNIRVEQFEHVFVDEYQDLTECEQTFVDLITAEDGSVVVLGDDDQSIYGFRYNHPEGITAFPADEERRKVVEQIPLPDNFRCAKRIVSLANGIAAAAHSKKDPMIPALAEDGQVDFVVWRTLDDEIAGLADVIKARRDNVLVLVTRQFIGYRLKALIGDDAVTTFHEEVLQVPFVRSRFALATLHAKEDDRVSLRAWFALNAEKPDQAPHRNVPAYRSALQSGRAGLELINGIADSSIILAGEGKANIKKRADSYLEFKALAPRDLQALIEMLFDPALADEMPGRPAPARETAAERTSRERLEREDRDHARGDLDLLRRAAIQIMQDRRQPMLLNVIEDLRYKIGTRAPLIDDDNIPRVRVMTLHGAKGLEEETVVVAGLADEIVPGIKLKDPAQDAAHVAEQRRLLYVAVTRAKRELVLSWSLAIPNAETFPNGIVRKRFAMNRNGVVYRRMTRTSLLPRQPEAPQDGQVWKQAQTEAAGAEGEETAAL